MLSIPDYTNNGFYLACAILAKTETTAVLNAFAKTVQDVIGHELRPDSPDLAELFRRDTGKQTAVYNGFRGNSTLHQLAMNSAITEVAKAILGHDEIDLLQKSPFRIDIPMETKELAVWHQDYFYVGGDPRTITVWVPFQNTDYFKGCLGVMPRSHKLGPLPHENQVLGKRHFPDGIFDREVRLVEMKEGDVLFFDGCLLHSGSVNLSDSIRYSTQLRYVRRDRPSDAGMGPRIQIA